MVLGSSPSPVTQNGKAARNRFLRISWVGRGVGAWIRGRGGMRWPRSRQGRGRVGTAGDFGPGPGPRRGVRSARDSTPERCTVGRRGVTPQACPGPVLGPRRQAGAERIPLDVTADGVKKFVFLDRERLEPARPDVAAMAVVLELAPNVRRHQPWHPPRHARAVRGVEGRSV